MRETMVINFSNPISSTNSDFSAVHQKSISVSIKGEDRDLLGFRDRIIYFIKNNAVDYMISNAEKYYALDIEIID